MAGPVLNIKIVAKSVSHSLRAISVITFPPAFLILLIQGIVSSRVNPAIGILPLFFSSAFSLLLLANEKKCGCQNSGLSGTPIHLVFDLLLGIGLLVCIILTWVFLPRTWNGGMIMLGTYGSNFLLTNFLIHCFFTAQQVYETLLPGMSYPSSCPQCQFQPFNVGINNVNLNINSRHGYAPLLDRQGEPSGADEERLNEAEAAV